MIRAIDLCSGAGGWACAARGSDIQIEAAIDLWQPACETYRINHPGTDVIQADLRDEKLRTELVERFRGIDLVLGAIPCEWLSAYRNLTTVSDEERDAERLTLDAVLGLVANIGPRWWCIEDVIQLKRELPILTPYIVLDAQHWSPQRRKRLFIGRFPKPKRAGCQQILGDRLRPGPYRVGRRTFGRTPKTHKTFDQSSTLAAFPHRKSPTILNQSSRRDAEMAVVSDTLPGGLRQLEWQEMARLQGFPEDYLFWGSPTDVSEMIGRAIQIDLGRAILEGIVRQWAARPTVTAEAG